MPEPSRPAYAYVIDYRIFDTEVARFHQEWTATTHVGSWLVLTAALLLTWKGFVPRWGRAAFLGLLCLALCLELATFSPAMVAEFSQVRPSGYFHDHFLYLETWRQMKLGHGYYAAAAQAFHNDARGQGATVRPPFLYYLWWLIPMPPSNLFIAFGAMAVAALCIGYGLAALLSSPNRALLAPVLLFPQYVYGAFSARWLFSEYWAVPLGMLSMALLLRGRLRASLGLGLCSALLREFLVLYFIGLSVAYAWRERARAVTPLVAAWIIWLGWVVVDSYCTRWVQEQNHMTGPPPLGGFITFGGWANLLACLQMGSQLNRPQMVVTLLVIGGAAGLWRLFHGGNGDAKKVWACGLLLYFPLFWVLGHAPTMVDGHPMHPPEEWGLFVLFWWFTLIPLGLEDPSFESEQCPPPPPSAAEPDISPDLSAADQTPAGECSRE